MPRQSAHRPSLPLGLLSAVIRARTTWEVVQFPAYLDWLRCLLDADADTPFTVEEYDRIADESFFHGVGDWVLASALNGDVGRAPLMRALAMSFVESMATQVLATSPTVVGCSTTFMRNTASLALLRAVKRRAPAVTTVLGGANCDGPMGAAVHRGFLFVDHVVRGEGEPAVVSLLGALERTEPAERDAGLAAIPGLCWRPSGDATVDPDRSRHQANPLAGHPPRC